MTARAVVAGKDTQSGESTRDREAALAEQRHQLTDPAEPPLACEAPKGTQ
jgi:hypothetical protein